MSWRRWGRFSGVGAALLLTISVHAEEYRLSYADWIAPRSGERILTLEPVQQVVRDVLYDERKGVEISYRGGEQGLIWANELAEWLVVLGLEPQRIELAPGHENEGELRLRTRSIRE